MKLFFLSLFLLLCLSLPFVYIYETNRITQYGFELQALRKNVDQLKRQNMVLEQQMYKLSSAPEIAQRIDALGMVIASDVSYVSKGPRAVSMVY